jgi:sulfatase maturation enzyme AslB (radical SAM superfamily)
MIGGEPLMEQEKFIEILKKCNLPGMNILITTNATVRPNAELMELLSKCKKVRWNLSIDAYGPLNNFLRKGSRWENVESNLHWFAENFPKNINVNGVVSIYNINNFFELSDYVASHYSWCRTAFNIIDGSDWMHPRNLPEQVKATVIEKIKNHPHVTVNRAIDAIQQQGDFTEFLSMDKKLSDIRNEDWSDLNSELYELVKDYK